MKKIFSILMLSACMLTAGAQKTVEAAKFLDNWSVGVGVSAITPIKHAAFWGNMRPAFAFELTKQFTPALGVSMQYATAVNTSVSSTAFDASHVALTGNINLSNLFWGYKTAPRRFEVEAVAGLGMAHAYMAGGEGSNFLTTKYGVNLNFRLGKAKAWTVSLRPALVYDLESNQPHARLNGNNAALELGAAMVYHFKNSNGKHHFTMHRAYDQAEVDALNAKINDLRTALSESKKETEKANNHARKIEKKLNDLRNTLPVVGKQD